MIKFNSIVFCLSKNKGDLNKIKAYLSGQGKFKYAHGDIASVSLPLKKVREIETKSWVDLVEIEINNIIPLSDTMLINNNIIPLHNSQSPLTDSLDGEGVIIGFLDTGVDFNHDDFKDVNGNSRIISKSDHERLFFITRSSKTLLVPEPCSRTIQGSFFISIESSVIPSDAQRVVDATKAIWS